MLQRLHGALRFWMLVPLILVVAALEIFTGLPTPWWVVVYAFAAALFYLVMRSVIDREGGPMRDRSESTHGNDMHGHYR